MTTTDRPPGKPWTLLEAAEFIGVSAKTLERAEKRGEIKTIYFGRRKFIPDLEVRRLGMEGLSADN